MTGSQWPQPHCIPQQQKTKPLGSELLLLNAAAVAARDTGLICCQSWTELEAGAPVCALRLEAPVDINRPEEEPENLTVTLPIFSCLTSCKGISESEWRVVPWGRGTLLLLSTPSEHTMFVDFCKESPKTHVLIKLRLCLHSHTGLAVSEKTCTLGAH